MPAGRASAVTRLSTRVRWVGPYEVGPDDPLVVGPEEPEGPEDPIVPNPPTRHTCEGAPALLAHVAGPGGTAGPDDGGPGIGAACRVTLDVPLAVVTSAVKLSTSPGHQATNQPLPTVACTDEPSLRSSVTAVTPDATCPSINVNSPSVELRWSSEYQVRSPDPGPAMAEADP